jgi:hypothetical protein
MVNWSVQRTTQTDSNKISHCEARMIVPLAVEGNLPTHAHLIMIQLDIKLEYHEEQTMFEVRVQFAVTPWPGEQSVEQAKTSHLIPWQKTKQTWRNIYLNSSMSFHFDTDWQNRLNKSCLLSVHTRC